MPRTPRTLPASITGTDPAFLTVAQLDALPAQLDAPAARPVPANVARRERAVLDAVYPFLNFSDRDAAYLAFYVHLENVNVIATGAGFFSVADMLSRAVRIGKRHRNPFAPATIASAPAADAGAHNRAEAAGYIVRIADAPDGSARFRIANIPDDATGAAAADARNRIATATAAAERYAASIA